MSGRSSGPSQFSRRQVIRQLSVAAGSAALAAAAFNGDAALAEEPHWTYGDATHWQDLSPSFGACGGRHQSPVDLGSAVPAKADALTVDWVAFAADATHNGHTLQVAPRGDAKAGALTLGGMRFDFVQFHFHHPSEHALAGKRWPVELHLVHKAADGKLTVLGILFRPGRENDALANILTSLPRAGQSRPVGKPVDLAGFLPKNAATFSYQGSLTTPPCSEIVSWIVFRDPIEAGIGQIESLRQALGANARPLQPSAGRRIGLDLF